MTRIVLILYFITVVISDSFSQKNILDNIFEKTRLSTPLVVNSDFYERAKSLLVNEKTNELLFQTKKYQIIGEISFNKYCKGLIAIDINDSIRHSVNLILCSPSGTLIDNIFIYQSGNSNSTSSVISKNKIFVTTEKYILVNNEKILNDYSQSTVILHPFNYHPDY